MHVHTVCVQYITARMSTDDNDNENESDWQFAAMVVDRLCLYLMSVCTILSVLYIIVAAPYLDT